MGSLSERKEIAYRCLIDAARSLSSAADVNELVGRILDASRDVMQCRACSISLPDPATGDLLISGTQPELKGRSLRVPAGRGISGRVFRTRKPENILNAQSDADHYTGIGIETQTPARAMLTIPVEDGDVCHGVMQALNPTNRDRFDDFDEEVFMAFAALIATTLTRMKAQAAAKEREVDDAYRRAELSVARRAQHSFMPSANFACAGLQVRIFQEQAADIGGDFFTYYELSDGSFLAAVGDASGKGIPAALESARVCTLLALKATLCTFGRFPEWIAEVNEVLRDPAQRAGSLTTLAILLIDRERRWLRACSFGQFRPRYLSLADREWQELACEVYPPLGVLSTGHFAVMTVPFAAGQAWLLLTDGFVEARNAAGDQFGQSILARSLSEATRENQDTLVVLEKRWREFTVPGPDRDDATALLLQATSAPLPRVLSLNLVPECMAEARAFFQRWTESAGFTDHESYQIVLACDEILTNIYKHAYRNQGGPIDCEGTIYPNALSFRITHSGAGLDQATYAAQLATAGIDPDHSRAGGYGLSFIRQVFDDVRFERQGAQCAVRVTRRVES
ncbi:MAG: SpoIIE family protein phosphatase [Verrucomicrobia bacterium]|nr:SpoIIE family protein phosphatase [Verrucomicrobiota bacterium]